MNLIKYFDFNKLITGTYVNVNVKDLISFRNFVIHLHNSQVKELLELITKIHHEQQSDAMYMTIGNELRHMYT